MNNFITVLPIEKLHPRGNARPLNNEALADLADSIEAVGLINPIRVRPLGGQYEIIAGRHRFTACDSLGWKEIPCVIVDDDDRHAEMSMIAENLHRADLTALERDEQITRWIELSGQNSSAESSAASLAQEPLGNDSEVLAQVEPKPPGGRPEGGTRAAARELGIEKEDARRAVKVSSLSPEAKAVAREIGVDDNRTALLDAAKHTSPEAQVEALKARQGGIAGRIETKRTPTYEGMRAAILLLRELNADDMTRICPPAKRAGMCQQLSALIVTFEQVKESVLA